MVNLVVLVLSDRNQCGDIVDAWEAAGASGITILKSMGLGRRQVGIRDDVPLMPGLSDLLANRELYHRTLFAVIEDETVLDRVIAATERVIGDFTRHHTGLLFVVPVTRVLGLEKKR